MDAAYFWQKAATCLRRAQTLSPDNPGRLSLIEMAVGYERRARALEAANLQSQQKNSGNVKIYSLTLKTHGQIC